MRLGTAATIQMSGAPDNVTLAKTPAIKFAKNAAATNRLSASMTTGGRSAAIVISSGLRDFWGAIR